MKFFYYKALTPEGVTVKGLTVGEDEAEVRQLLEAKGLYLYRFLRVPTLLGQIVHGITRPKVERQELIDLAENMALMVRSGIPVLSALETLRESARSKAMRDVLGDVHDSVRKGLRLSDALAFHQDVFPPVFINLVRVGEETGRLDKAFEDVAGHLGRIEELRAAIQRALLYPIFAIVASFGAILFWLVYVLPKVVAAMEGMGVELPALTRAMVSVGNLLQTYYWSLPLFFLLAFILYGVSKERKALKGLKDRLALCLPVMKTIASLRNLSLFCEQMRILIEAGIPIGAAMERAAEVVPNAIIKEAILRARERVVLGERISAALRAQEVFPPMLLRFVEVGESTGRLGDGFAYLSEYYIEKLRDYSERLGKVIEPVVIGFIGAFFAIVMVSLFAPVYDMISRIGM